MATKPERIEIVGVPLDLGAGLRGVDMGPGLCPLLTWDKLALHPSSVVLVGVRSLDPGERVLIARLGPARHGSDPIGCGADYTLTQDIGS